MNKSLKTLLFSCVLLLYVSAFSSAQTCNKSTFSNNRLYATCTDLPYLNASLHWTHNPLNGTVDIAYRHAGVDSSRWVAWALNLNNTGMIGAQSLVALHNASGAPRAYTSAVSGYGTLLAETRLSFEVTSLSAEYASNAIIIYATLVLPSGRTSFNQVWQNGPVSGGTPMRHSMTGDSVRSMGTIDFAKI